MKLKTVLGFVGMCSVFTISGCYTQFATTERKPIPEVVDTIIDSTGDTVKVIQRTDTIFQKEEEICVWERDLMGYPRLNCYKSYYPRDWFMYNHSPWWYRNDPYWYDYDRCPRYYYYDYSCGCCKYYTERHDSHHHDHDYNHNDVNNGNNGNSGGSKPSSSPSVRSGRTLPQRVQPAAPQSEQAGSPKVVAPRQDAPVTEPQKAPQFSDSTPAKPKAPRSLRSR